MVKGIVDEQEYKEMKAEYSARLEEAEQATLSLNAEIEKALSNKGEKNVWIEHSALRRKLP